MVIFSFSRKNICQETIGVFVYISTSVLYEYMKLRWNDVMAAT